MKKHELIVRRRGERYYATFKQGVRAKGFGSLDDVVKHYLPLCSEETLRNGPRYQGLNEEEIHLIDVVRATPLKDRGIRYS